jgi:F-type H+/Na+-transporting ATPase subunit alpha
VSAFVPTNVISITDGQIFLETDLFNAGIRPAINAGLSVSRVGGCGPDQDHQEARRRCAPGAGPVPRTGGVLAVRLRPGRATRKQLERGQRITELMKQPQYSPLSVAEMAVSLFAGNEGYLDDLPLNKVSDFEAALRDHMNAEHKT